MKARFKVGDIVGISTNYIHFPANGKTGKIKSILEFPNGDIYYCIKAFDGPFNVCIRECEAFPPMAIREVIASAYPHRAYMDAVGKMIHEREERKMSMTPKKIMRNGPATIVFWEDGTKTVVKKMPSDKDDIYAAFCAAFTKKYFGSNEKVKATVDSLCGPSKEEIERLVNYIQAKYGDDFCKGYGVVISKSSLKCDDRTFYEIREKLAKQGFITERATNCYYTHRWIVKRDDTKHIKWCLEHKSFAEKLVITPAYTGGDSYRMCEIARELAEAGYSVKCLYGSGNRDYIYTIKEIEVNKK